LHPSLKPQHRYYVVLDGNGLDWTGQEGLGMARNCLKELKRTFIIGWIVLKEQFRDKSFLSLTIITIVLWVLSISFAVIYKIK